VPAGIVATQIASAAAAHKKTLPVFSGRGEEEDGLSLCISLKSSNTHFAHDIEFISFSIKLFYNARWREYAPFGN
jgi:hypothetical protein